MRDAFHREFRLNGIPLEYDDLSEVAYSLVKEGAPYEREAGDFLLDWVSDSASIVQRTSGSTGPPKPIALSKSALVHSAAQTVAFFDLGAGSRVLSCLPVSRIAGKMMWIRALTAGWNLELTAPAAAPLQNVSGRFHFTAMVPMQLLHSLPEISRVQTVLVGGAPVPAGLLRKLPVRNTEVWESYGMTETASHIALRPLSRIAPGDDPESVLPPFRALEGIRLETDDRGCLKIDAPGLLAAPLLTNDMVRMESPDTFRWVGRWDRVVNSGGVKLIPEQLESRLDALIACRYFLTGVPDETLGEHLALVVEGPEDPEALQRTIRESGVLTGYEIPREIRMVDAFEITPGGKTDREATCRRLGLY